jgi:hypothetical protein
MIPVPTWVNRYPKVRALIISRTAVGKYSAAVEMNERKKIDATIVDA